MREKKIFNGDYTVRDDGYIKNNKKTTTPFCLLNGYKTIGYKGKTFYVHRLIAQAFIPNPNMYPCVNHKNGNKQDNRTKNLEWCTHSYNNKEAYRLGLRKPNKKTSKHRSVVMINDDNEEICIFKKMKYADIFFKKKVSPNIKRSIETGIKAYGYHWRYL